MMKSKQGVNKLGDIIPAYIKKGLGYVETEIKKESNDSVKQFIEDDKQIEINKERSETLGHQKSIGRKNVKTKNIFIREKGVNGMVEKYSDAEIFRQNSLKVFKNEPANSNAMELILTELLTRLKNRKDITNRELAAHMTKHYKKNIAFAVGPKTREDKVEKYVVQIMGKVFVGLANTPDGVKEGLIEKPLIQRSHTSYGMNTGRRLCFNLLPDFFLYSAATLRAVCWERWKLNESLKKEAKILAKLKKSENDKDIKTEKTELKIDDTIKLSETEVIKELEVVEEVEVVEKVEVVEEIKKQTTVNNEQEQIKPIQSLSSIDKSNIEPLSMIERVVEGIDMALLIKQVIDREGSFKLSHSSIEINMNKENKI